MVSCYTATDVLDMISDWEVTADYQVDPLDVAQCVTCRTTSAETNTSSNDEDSECDTGSSLPSSITSSTQNHSLAFDHHLF